MNPNRILVCPDSFKGTLTAKQAARAIADAAELVFRDAVVDLFPLADGGEGTLDCLAACGFSVVRISVRHPLNGTVNARYLYRDKTAVIESAEAIGLPLVGADKNPLLTTSYGLGELIADAIGRGAETVFVTLGGSSTNDGGCGVAAALGYRFFDATGHEFLPTGGTLSAIDRIVAPHTLPDIRIIVWTDIDNPVCGMRGASYVFAPQKGASSADLPLLDNGLRHLCQLLDADPDTPGGGAAGGLGIGLKIFCGATLRPGIEEILRLTQFDRALDQVDLVVTGEGKFDDQSLMGKVFSGVTAHTRPRGIPVAVVAGKASPVSAEQLESAGVVLVAESDPAPDGDYRTDAYRRLRDGAARAFSQLADKFFNTGVLMNQTYILSLCDHTLLAPDATWDDIRTVLDDAVRFETASACIPPCFLKAARAYVGDALKLTTVIGFPTGYQTTSVKVAETLRAVGDGADEIDMVLNIGDLKSGKQDSVLDEIKQIRAACQGKILKVIIETCLLSDAEKIDACRIVGESGADFIKTSTGFSKGGATAEDVRLLRLNVPAHVKVKAAGGIRSWEDAMRMIESGADRLGTSALVRLAKQ